MPLLADIENISSQLEAICKFAEELESRFASELAAVHPNYADSAKNLIHYLALRHADIRNLQDELAHLGLSSLGRAEQHVMPSLRAVLHALRCLKGDPDSDLEVAGEEFEASNARLEQHILDLIGSNPDGRIVEIMVTMPAEAAYDYQLVHGLLAAGMDIARINCAHDTKEEWRRMITHIRRAAEHIGKTCKVVMDLAGPKIRSGQLQPGPGVLSISLRRDGLGRLIAPRRIRLVANHPLRRETKATVLPVPEQCIEIASVGDRFFFRDTRGRKRVMDVVHKDDRGLVAEIHKRAYIEAGTKLNLCRKESGEKLRFRVGDLPLTELPIVLRVGDELILDSDDQPGNPAVYDAEGSVIEPARISLRPPEVLRQVPVGAPILINDGKIEGFVRENTARKLVVEVTHAKPTGSRLRPNRSINFPGIDLHLSGLSDTDKEDLRFIVEHADAVSLSFVHKPADIICLQRELNRYPDSRLGIVVKIETELGFSDLPRILLTAMRTYPAGIMIARGDLAVECGWERLAEIQEEMLWLCEAAQLPVIWATQVLEGKAKKGRPTRAEITDAAMAQRADCVMLNKGPHILAAIGMLDDILRRMQTHQTKKTARLRKLSISEV